MSYQYRKERISKIVSSWKLYRTHDLMARYKLNNKDLFNIKLAIKLYISKALHFQFSPDDEEFLHNVDKARSNSINFTPNGAVVPKREFQLEYNIVLREWSKIIHGMTKENPALLSRFRTTPNIRIKFGKELEDNITRPLSTSLPHSDAWVEGPWGMNCYFPIFGDVDNNNLQFYTPVNFSEDHLNTAKTYDEMQWVLKNYEKNDELKPIKNWIHISDYALIHNTERKKSAKTRISIDTTIFIGDHLPHEDRLVEYRDKIPSIGIMEFIDAGRSEKDNIEDNKTTFSHYTTNKIKTIKLT